MVERLILVKHSLPQIEPSAEAPLWRLGAEGRRRCALLARRLATFSPEAILTSSEPKAIETGERVAAVLGLSSTVHDGLHEHDRTGVPFYENPRDFQRRMARFFRGPQTEVFGAESAAEARARFDRAIRRACRLRHRTLAVVTHGTVIALYVAGRTNLDAFALWRRLDLPSFVVLSGARVAKVTESVLGETT